MSIQKKQVATGIYWIEIAEADLRILCGCPADSVKYLIRRGLILPHEIGGVACQTGPNAILLSDRPLQHGEFANMAEFPVLQMLYLQGMLIPRHPNNIGRKPILIGTAEQIKSQMQYIYRGNYGLVSKQEIVQAGIPEAEAEAMMRLKLRFAFGRILPTSELLETRIIGADAVEIQNGVRVRRLRQNVFEFRFKGAWAVVDLNLAPGEHYESAYPLGFRNIERDYFSVIHSGEGDGWDASRPSMSSIITFQGKVYLLDAGPNLANILIALGMTVDEVEGVFQTHAHDDHFAGIACLMRAGRRLKFYATPLVRATVAKKVAALLSIEEECFADFFDVCDLSFNVWNDIEGLEVKPIFSPHPVETNIYIFRTLWEDGYRSYAHFADIVSLRMLEGMASGKSGDTGLSRKEYETVRDAYLTPVDLKKIDIGGGMIHGAAEDFRADTSGKILLAHRAGELRPEEKEIGSSAAFGTRDTLVAGHANVSRRSCFSYLSDYFPHAPQYQIRILLNHPIVVINPGEIIIREGTTPKHVLVIVSGAIEKIRAKDNLLSILAAGTVIGDTVGIDGASPFTYRAASFVQALKVSVKLFREIMLGQELLEKIRHTEGIRLFLESTDLLGEGIPASVMSSIINQTTTRTYKAGEKLNHPDLELINIIETGRIERRIGQELLDTLGPKAHFGEEWAVFETPCLYRLEVIQETHVYLVPGKLLAGIPMIRWKLLESYRSRVSNINQVINLAGFYPWRDEFSINVSQMDIHHQRLFEIANSIGEILRSGGDAESLAMTLGALGKYARYHFSAEEELMARYAYPETDQHISLHRELERQVADYRSSMLERHIPSEAELMQLIESLLVRHILEEDKKYAVFLNAHSIF